MYYSSGNYEAFARPKKPAGVDSKSAYIVGSGLAALTAACYLVRDGQMKGEPEVIVDRLAQVMHGNVTAALERLRIDKDPSNSQE